MSGDELRQGIEGAALVICNDYELELIRQKTGFGEAEILAHAGGLVVTKGEKGCTIITGRPAGRRRRRSPPHASSIPPVSATHSAAGS